MHTISPSPFEFYVSMGKAKHIQYPWYSLYVDVSWVMGISLSVILPPSLFRHQACVLWSSFVKVKNHLKINLKLSCQKKFCVCVTTLIFLCCDLWVGQSLLPPPSHYNWLCSSWPQGWICALNLRSCPCVTFVLKKTLPCSLTPLDLLFLHAVSFSALQSFLCRALTPLILTAEADESHVA